MKTKKKPMHRPGRWYLPLLFFVAAGLLACSAPGANKAPERLDAGKEPLVRGIELFRQGCGEKALGFFLKAHEWYTAADDLSGVATCLNNIGNVYRARGGLDEALLYYREAAGIYTECRDRQGAVQALTNIAAVLIDRGCLELADQTLSVAEQVSEEVKIRSVSLMKNRGIYWMKKKDFTKAEAALDRALAATADTDIAEKAAVHFALGRLALETGRPEEALSHMKAALAGDRQAGYYRGEAEDLAQMAGIYDRRQDAKSAARLYMRAVKIYALLGDREKVDALSGPLRAAAEKGGIDTTLSDYFSKEWIEQRGLIQLCR
jgi:tetratricopeptide (TPR) repeat protein